MIRQGFCTIGRLGTKRDDGAGALPQVLLLIVRVDVEGFPLSEHWIKSYWRCQGVGVDELFSEVSAERIFIVSIDTRTVNWTCKL